MPETAEEYYDSIAAKYDWFYASWDAAGEEQCRQLTPLFRQHGVQRVLDCACGNGLQAVALAREGFNVSGSDLSARMLEEADKKCREEGVDIPLIHADIRELRAKAPGPFEAVICMGNVLPHLKSDAEIRDALRNMHGVLAPGGLLVIEGRYYDDLVQDKPRFIPHRVHACTDHEQSVTILYVLDYLEAYIRFNIVFLVKDERGEVSLDVDTVDYNPILAAHMQDLLADAGFEDVRLDRYDDRFFCTAVRLG